MGSILGVFHVIFESSISLDHFFSPRIASFSTGSGLANACCIILAGVIGYGIFHLLSTHTLTRIRRKTLNLFYFISSAFLLSIIVERSKKCVDFTATLYIIHVFSCIYYSKVEIKLIKLKRPNMLKGTTHAYFSIHS